MLNQLVFIGQECGGSLIRSLATSDRVAALEVIIPE